MLRSWSSSPFFKHFQCLCDITICIALWRNRVTPTAFLTVRASLMPLPQSWLVQVVLYYLQLSYQQQSVYLSHFSTRIVFFSTHQRDLDSLSWRSLDCVQITHSFSILADWLLLLPVTAITSVLCIIKILPIWVVCHGYWKSAVCSIPKSSKGRYLYCNWINIAFYLKGTSTLIETTSNGDC